MAGTTTRRYGKATWRRIRPSAASDGKAPRTARGEKTLRKILDAALAEFGQRGFSESSIVGITRRAKVALGTFYTYFDSKEAVFAALVRDMSARVRDHVAPVTRRRERRARRRTAGAGRLSATSSSAIRKSTGSSTRPNSSIPAGFRTPLCDHRRTHRRPAARRRRERGEIATTDALADEVRAWAIMGMNVFLGLRFGVWGRRGSRDGRENRQSRCCATG